MNRKGFTLIEILVVVGILGVIMTTVVSVMLNTFKAKNRADVGNRLEQSGSYLQIALRRNVLNSSSAAVECPDNGGVGSSMTVINKVDGESTRIECSEVEASIASISASGTYKLSGMDVGVSGCNTFISCQTLPETGNVESISFNFYLYSLSGNTSPDSYVKRRFENKVVVRNN